jgi:hypothetical protein
METLFKEKQCLVCKKIKSLNEFGFHKRDKNFKSRCKECLRKEQKVYIEKNREQYLVSQSFSQLKQNYGITKEEYEDKIKSQDGKCAICSAETPQQKNIKRFSVDHCHKTKQVRGLLCSPCNKGLGCFYDNISNLEKAVEYLRCYQEGL